MKTQYIITGVSEQVGECLIAVCGDSLENAERTLRRMVIDPDDTDRKLIGNKTDLKIKEVTRYADAWWLWDYS